MLNMMHGMVWYGMMQVVRAAGGPLQRTPASFLLVVVVVVVVMVLVLVCVCVCGGDGTGGTRRSAQQVGSPSDACATRTTLH